LLCFEQSSVQGPSLRPDIPLQNLMQSKQLPCSFICEKVPLANLWRKKWDYWVYSSPIHIQEAQ